MPRTSPFDMIGKLAAATVPVESMKPCGSPRVSVALGSRTSNDTSATTSARKANALPFKSVAMSLVYPLTPTMRATDGDSTTATIARSQSMTEGTAWAMRWAMSSAETISARAAASASRASARVAWLRVSSWAAAESSAAAASRPYASQNAELLRVEGAAGIERRQAAIGTALSIPGRPPGSGRRSGGGPPRVLRRSDEPRHW